MMGSLRDGKFSKYGVEQMGSSADGLVQKMRVEDMGISRDEEFDRWGV